MTCFQWQTHSSEFLDGSLTESIKRDAEDHLESCNECSERLKHYRIILSSIASQPKVTLPATLRKSPLTSSLPRLESSKLSFTRWQLIPWYLRTFIEALGIVTVILIVLSSTPKIRTIYEKSIEKSISDFKDSATLHDGSAEDGNHAVIPLEANLGSAATGQDELEGEDEEEESETLHVGRSQLWRFTLKTVSPDEMRPQVVKALTSIGIPAGTPGLGGIQVPGGIEFDLVLAQSLVPEVKRELEKLVPNTTDGSIDSPGNENFSWYKVKSKRKIPEGKSQVVVWLSQPTL